MGRFSCTKCGCGYYEARFVWEPTDSSAEDTFKASEASETSTQEGSDVDSDVESLSSESNAGDALVMAAPAAPEGPECDHPTSPRDTADVAAEKVEGAADLEMPSGAGAYADVIRFTGVLSDITGSLATGVAVVGRFCSPISAIADFVEITSGVTLFVQGVSTPSGTPDSYRISKGGATVAFGSGSMVMVSLAAVHPVLFVGALSMGAAGLVTTTVLDATMSGLCEDCRRGDETEAPVAAFEEKQKEEEEDKKEEEEEETSTQLRPRRHSTQQYELTELIWRRACGYDA